MSTELTALLGVAVGALLSWLATELTERSRFRRARRIHWRDRRLDAYLEFAVATKKYMAVLFRIGASLGVDPVPERLSLDEAQPLLAVAFEERDSAFERMRLVGSETLVLAAQAWVASMLTMRKSLDAPDALTSERWKALIENVSAKRSEFHRLAQLDLGVELEQR